MGIDNGSVMDVVEIDAASNNGVKISETCGRKLPLRLPLRNTGFTLSTRYMLSIGAFNALLKIPGGAAAHVVFILATTEVHKLFKLRSFPDASGLISTGSILR